MPSTDNQLTAKHVAYLETQRLGRLATVDADGRPQNNPVGFKYNAELGTVDIGGYNMGASRKFRNLAANPHVAFVVDDIASYQPWRVRCLEIRGTAEGVSGEQARVSGFSGEIIRIHPTRVIAFGLDNVAG